MTPRDASGRVPAWLRRPATTAPRVGGDRATHTVRNVSGAWVKEQKIEVTADKITERQVILEVTFVLE